MRRTVATSPQLARSTLAFYLAPHDRIEQAINIIRLDLTL
jgi:hypothetical protein